MNHDDLEAELARINAMALWDFTAAALDNGDVLVMGSNNFTYYHDLELTFSGVFFSELPATFRHALFRLDRSVTDRVCVWANAVGPDHLDERDFEIQAAGMTARIGKVVYEF